MARSVEITGTSMHLPSRAVSASEIDVLASIPAGWTLKHSGVARRYFADGESASEMGARAVEGALTDAGTPLGSIQAIVSAGATMEQPIPCNAALIAERLAVEGVMTFDVNSTCLGFLAALDVVSCQIQAGSCDRAVIVASEVGSPGLDWASPESCSIIGDGAAAVVVGRSERSAIYASMFRTYPEGAHLTEIRGGGSGLHAGNYTAESARDYLFSMNSRGVFRMAANLLPGFVDDFFKANGFCWNDFQLVIPHQASLSALRLMQRRLGIPKNRFFVYVENYGNTIAASIPMGLHLARAEGRLKRGDNVLLIGTGAGFSIGAVALRF